MSAAAASAASASAASASAAGASTARASTARASAASASAAGASAAKRPGAARPGAARGAPSPEVFAACRRTLARGSKSFSAAARLLPGRLVDPVAAFYAFCRVSDDAVDESDAPRRAIERLQARVDKLFAGEPEPHAPDEAFAWVVRRHRLPRAPVDALLDGYRWDVERRRYETLSGVLAYSARVAASVGVVMTLLMGRRERWVLHRAADLGVAMQLTNIARDVGEDARNGRVYLPLAWLRAEGVSPEAFVDAPAYAPGLGVAVCRLLDHAERLYRRAEPGVAALPADCRLAIAAARLIYADIGRVIRARGYDSVSGRAYTSGLDKLRQLPRALPFGVGAGPGGPLGPRPACPYDAPPLDETRFLLEDLA